MFIVAMLFVVVIGLAILVFEIVALWKVFVKAGEEGWKAIVPFLNIYELFKISWDTKFFWFYLGAQVVGGALAGSGNDTLSMIGALISLGGFVLTVMMLYYLAKSFGEGAGFTVGLVLLQFIFLMILGFGSAQYIGNGSVIVAAEKSGSVTTATTVDSTPVDSATTVDSTATETQDDPMGPSDSNF